jgi:hypothetical protein
MNKYAVQLQHQHITDELRSMLFEFFLKNEPSRRAIDYINKEESSLKIEYHSFDEWLKRGCIRGLELGIRTAIGIGHVKEGPGRPCKSQDGCAHLRNGRILQGLCWDQMSRDGLLPSCSAGLAHRT